MNKIDTLQRMISELKPEERSRLDDHLLNAITNDAEAKRSQYRLEIASDYIEEARELVKSWGQMQGISSGYQAIDAMTKGFVGGEVIVIGGATSNGKTTLAVNMAARMIEADVPVLFVTLEMTKAQLTSRLLYVNDAFEDNAALLSYQQCDELNWESVDGLISQAVNEMHVKVVVIDHLHYFTRELQNVAEDLGRITKEFKKNANRYNIPIILISHTRKGEGTSIDDLRGSSYIAQDADIVMMVSRKREYQSQICVTIEKNRNRGYDPLQNELMMVFDKTKIYEDYEYKALQSWST